MPKEHHSVLTNPTERTGRAVAHYWKTRAVQGEKQKQTGRADQGLRSAVTGGAQMNGFIDLFPELITSSGIPERYIFRKKAVELPGFFRPTKEWDLLVVREDTLLVAIEAKSQVGPSFGNNFNNRTATASWFPEVAWFALSAMFAWQGATSDATSCSPFIRILASPAGASVSIT